MSSSVPTLKRFKNGFPFFSLGDKTQAVLSRPQERVEYKTGREIKSRERREIIPTLYSAGFIPGITLKMDG